MNHQEFNELIHDQFENSAATLSSKAGEYASDDDRFHNFHVAARIKGETPEKALDGMRVKHSVVIRDWIETSDQNPERFTPEMLTEKIGDEINYLLLLKGLLTDRYAKYHNVSLEEDKPSWTEPQLNTGIQDKLKAGAR